MPDASTYSGIPVPTGPEAGDVPGSLSALRAALDPQVVLKATSQADRDTRFSGIAAGQLVSCALSSTTGIVWMKTTTPPTAAAWIILAERQAPVTSGVVTAATNFSVTSQWAQRVNGLITIACVLSYSGPNITADSGGDIPDTPICTIQSTYLPPAALLAVNIPVATTLSVRTAAAVISTSGVVSLVSSVPSVTIGPMNVRFSATYPGA